MAWWMVAVGVVGGYVGASLLLLHCPTLLHKKKQLKFRCKHISHRGGAGERLENTMSAFRHAVDDCRTDMLELDCQLTSDGQVVVAHDDRLDRICGVDKSFSDFIFEELPDILPTLPVTFYRKDYEMKITNGIIDRRVPLLRDVFSAFPTLPINLDVKTENQELLDKVAALISEFDREAITPWGNFRESVNRNCFKKNPAIPLIFSMKRVAIVLMLFYTGLLPFIPLKESCFEIIMPSTATKLFGSLTWKRRVLIWIIDLLLMRPMLFRHLQRRGIIVFIWVLNEDEEYERAFRLGADGIMTDFPTKLREFLDKNESLLSNIK